MPKGMWYRNLRLTLFQRMDLFAQSGVSRLRLLCGFVKCSFGFCAKHWRNFCVWVQMFNTANWESDTDFHQGYVAKQLEEHCAESPFPTLVISLRAPDFIDLLQGLGVHPCSELFLRSFIISSMPSVLNISKWTSSARASFLDASLAIWFKRVS